jgi:hypothetical protein
VSVQADPGTWQGPHTPFLQIELPQQPADEVQVAPS